MLQQIILRTPPWVWAILAFLVYRGIVASADREIRFAKIFITPLAMLGLSIHGIVTTFGIHPVSTAAWLGGIVAAGWLARNIGRDRVTADPQRGTLFQRGSWMPMMLMMGIFLTKYVVAVVLAMHPSHRESGWFVAGITVLYGLCNGIFIGQLIGTATVYRRAWNEWQARSQLQAGGSRRAHP